MNKTNNLGQHIYVDCKNCNNFDTYKLKCKKENFNICTTNYAEVCNSFDCDKNINEEAVSEEKVCKVCGHVIGKKYRYTIACTSCGHVPRKQT